MAKINVDCDGVVADLIPYLWDCLAKEGLPPEPVSDPKWRTWDVLKLLTEEQQQFAFAWMGDHNWWRKLPVVPYAQEAISALRSAGHRIHWITTAWDDCFGWRDARRDWLHRNFDDPAQNLHKDLTVTGDKAETWADVFIDDKPSAIIDWHKHHPAPAHRGILYKTNFNHAHHDDLENIVWSPESVSMLLGWLEEKYGA